MREWVCSVLITLEVWSMIRTLLAHEGKCQLTCMFHCDADDEVFWCAAMDLGRVVGHSQIIVSIGV